MKLNYTNNYNKIYDVLGRELNKISVGTMYIRNQRLYITKMIKFLKLLSDIVDPNYWASKISKKTGLEEKARNSKFRKWEAGLTGWKHWAWQIGGGILFFIIFEYLINLIGLTMIP